MHPKTKQHIPFKTGKDLSGTPRYSSITAHLGYEQSRRDDLEAICYMLVYLFNGSLPWQGYCSHISSLAERCRQIGKFKQMHPVEKLCAGMPSEIMEMLQYSRSLEFEEEPKYVFLKQLMITSLRRVKAAKNPSPTANLKPNPNSDADSGGANSSSSSNVNSTSTNSSGIEKKPENDELEHRHTPVQKGHSSHSHKPSTGSKSGGVEDGRASGARSNSPKSVQNSASPNPGATPTSPVLTFNTLTSSSSASSNAMALSPSSSSPSSSSMPTSSQPSSVTITPVASIVKTSVPAGAGRVLPVLDVSKAGHHRISPSCSSTTTAGLQFSLKPFAKNTAQNEQVLHHTPHPFSSFNPQNPTNANTVPVPVARRPLSAFGGVGGDHKYVPSMDSQMSTPSQYSFGSANIVTPPIIVITGHSPVGSAGSPPISPAISPIGSTSFMPLSPPGPLYTGKIKSGGGGGGGWGEAAQPTALSPVPSLHPTSPLAMVIPSTLSSNSLNTQDTTSVNTVGIANEEISGQPGRASSLFPKAAEALPRINASENPLPSSSSNPTQKSTMKSNSSKSSEKKK